MNYAFSLHFRIILQSALAIQSGSGGGHFNQTVMRDRNGFFIPASSQKGRLRFYCQRICGLLPPGAKPALTARMEQLFGNVTNRIWYQW